MANVQKQIVLTGGLFKLPTWSKGPAKELEKQFKLRFLELRKEGPVVRIVYYKNKEAYQAGKAPLGSLDVLASSYQRISKLDFVLTSDRKRLYCRAFSELIANNWEDALFSVGVGQ